MSPMTWACDELYLCGYRGRQEPPEACWYNTFSTALKPRMEQLAGDEGWRIGPAASWWRRPKVPWRP
jgi:hypothetical protein